MGPPGVKEEYEAATLEGEAERGITNKPAHTVTIRTTGIAIKATNIHNSTPEVTDETKGAFEGGVDRTGSAAVLRAVISTDTTPVVPEGFVVEM